MLGNVPSTSTAKRRPPCPPALLIDAVRRTSRLRWLRPEGLRSSPSPTPRETASRAPRPRTARKGVTEPVARSFQGTVDDEKVRRPSPTTRRNSAQSSTTCSRTRWPITSTRSRILVISISHRRDLNCAVQSFGEVQRYFLRHPCKGLKQRLIPVADTEGNVLVVYLM